MRFAFTNGNDPDRKAVHNVSTLVYSSFTPTKWQARTKQHMREAVNLIQNRKAHIMDCFVSTFQKQNVEIALPTSIHIPSP